MLEGIVKWFNRKKGFGFITGSDGTDYFVHQSDILMEGYRFLRRGQAVSFEPDENEKGAIARNVQI